MTQAIEKLHEEHHPSTLKYKVGVVIGSKWVDFGIMVLLFLDLILVKIEVGIDYHVLCIAGERLRIPQEKILELRDIEGPADIHFQVLQPAQKLSLPGRKTSLLSQKRVLSLETHEPHAAPSTPRSGRLVDRKEEAERALATAKGEHMHQSGSLICEDKFGHTAHHVEHHCHFWSTVILCIFMLELLIKIWVSPRAFFGNVYHVIDFVIVTLSLAFDLASHFLHMMELEVVAVILVVCRLWRILRIIHALFELVHTQVEHVDELEQEVAETRAEVEKVQEKLRRLEKRNA